MIQLNGKFIGVREKTSVFTLEKVFVAASCEKAALRVTALGLYFAEVNGKRVGDAYLTPGWTSYNKMLQVQSYDVSDLLTDGENTIVITVAQGWYCGRLMRVDGDLYGDRSAVCAALKVGNREIVTDLGWHARESYIRSSSIYDGETQEFMAELKPLTPCVVEHDKNTLVAQMCEPVRNIERVAVKQVIRTPNGELVYDFGQNMAGVVELKTSDNFRGTLTLEFAEILVNGNFYTDNYRTAKSTDTFTVCGKKTLVPEFTFHGFRYMKLTGGELPAENVTAIVRHTDLRSTGRIITDNARFDRLLENVVWGQKSNFIDIPTDCPQRDERLGWTGDINVFCRTAAYNYDIRAFMKKWLADMRNEQTDGGEVPRVIPDVLGEAGTRAMWCDAIVMVPWTLFEMYGDRSFLKDNYAAMKKYIVAKEKTTVDGLVGKCVEYGDWLALDGERLLPDSPFGRTDKYFVANVLFSHTLDITAKTAEILGDEKEARRIITRREKLLRDMRSEYFTSTGRLAFDTVTAQTLALHFGIAEEKFRPRLAKALNDNVVKHDYRVCTGFVGTPFLLFALADNGYLDTAEKVLLGDRFPSWLYEVDMGATTVWERWNSLMPDGTPNPDGMNSYNHYAYGSVMEFVYRRIAGIEPIEAGFRKIKVAPRPCVGLDALTAEYCSVSGKIVSGYERKNGEVIYRIEIPDGVSAEIVLPDKQTKDVGGGIYEFVI